MTYQFMEYIYICIISLQFEKQMQREKINLPRLIYAINTLAGSVVSYASGV